MRNTVQVIAHHEPTNESGETLVHYGVPGMKWGVRKAKKGSLRKRLSKALNRKKSSPAKGKVPAKKNASPFKDPKKMTYEDLKKEVDRLEKEKKYLELTGQTKAKTENWVKTALKGAAKSTLQNAASAIFSSVLSNAVTSFETGAADRAANKKDKKYKTTVKKQEKEAFKEDWLARKAAQKTYLDSPSRVLNLPAGPSESPKKKGSSGGGPSPKYDASTAASFVSRYFESDH